MEGGGVGPGSYREGEIARVFRPRVRKTSSECVAGTYGLDNWRRDRPEEAYRVRCTYQSPEGALLNHHHTNLVRKQRPSGLLEMSVTRLTPRFGFIQDDGHPVRVEASEHRR